MTNATGYSSRFESPILATDLGAATAAVTGAQRIAVMSHWRSDGDALGCVVALREVLRSLGKEVLAGVPDDVPARYHFLADGEPIPHLRCEGSPLADFAPDLVLIVDTSARAQMEPLMPFLEKCTAPRLIVDHHVTHDISAETVLYDTTAGAAGLILLDWFRKEGWTINSVAATALFVSMSTDTGWFHFSSADGRMYRAAAHLIEQYGVQPDLLYRQLYLQESVSRMRLLAELLGSLEMYEDGQLVVCTVTQEMFARSGAKYSETEDLINELQRIGSVRVAALLVEDPDGKTRMSLRSKDSVNVAAIAQRFGGGGHERAAGARTASDPATLKAQVIEAVGKELSDLVRP